MHWERERDPLRCQLISFSLSSASCLLPTFARFANRPASLAQGKGFLSIQAWKPKIVSQVSIVLLLWSLALALRHLAIEATSSGQMLSLAAQEKFEPKTREKLNQKPSTEIIYIENNKHWAKCKFKFKPRASSFGLLVYGEADKLQLKCNEAAFFW